MGAQDVLLTRSPSEAVAQNAADIRAGHRQMVPADEVGPGLGLEP